MKHEIIGMLNLKKQIQDFITKFTQEQEIPAKIIEQIHVAGGTVLMVGGAVRDCLLNQLTEDFDIEVYGLESQALEKILRQYGFVQYIGKAFGVYLLPGINIDWSLPRIDSVGRKPEVEVNPNLDFETAFRRRDLTINALGINLKTGELVDPFNGVQDLQNKVLRYVDRDLFTDDPLRFYRVMQFVGRLEMVPDAQLNELCNEMDLEDVSVERIEEEFSKLFLKSRNPGLGIKWLQTVGRLYEILPELYATIGVPQNPVWHPEGDVFEHITQALNAAARQEYASDSEKLTIMWAALCHDLGKVEATKLVDGVWKSTGHALIGVPLAKKLLERITHNQDLIKAVCKLVRYHMEPLQFIRNQAGVVAYKRLAINLYPQTIRLLAKLALADRAGRKAVGQKLPDKLDFSDDLELQKFVDQANLAGVWDQMEPPVLQGKDLLDVVKPGPKLGELLQRAYEIQIQESILDKSVLKKRVLFSK